MRLFVIIGWSIYPRATATQEILEISGTEVGLAVGVAALIYVIADVLNKVGFVIVAVNAAKKSSGIDEVPPAS